MKKKIYLSSPHMGGTEQNFVNEAFESNWIAPLGPNVEGFEKDLSSYLSKNITKNVHVAVLSSGTAALHLALILLGVQQEDEVICQSMTFSASANPIIYQGATPIFIDSEKSTWNMCPKALEEAIKDRIKKGKKPKAIIAVHLYGMPYNVEEIKKVALTYEIPIIEDSAEALGSTFENKKCGTFGDIGILSFNGNKIITTSGGGALVAPTDEIKKRAVFLATQARENAPHYEHKEVGYNYRMSNVCAGIGRGQMQVLEKHMVLRRKNNDFYRKEFVNWSGIQVFREPDKRYFSNHWLSCILIDRDLSNGLTSEKIKQAFDLENIETRPLWKPMHLQPVFEKMPYYGEKVAENLFKNGLCLPSGSNLTQGDLNRIKEVLNNLKNKKHPH